jgi:hypothetical protein
MLKNLFQQYAILYNVITKLLVIMQTQLLDGILSTYLAFAFAPQNTEQTRKSVIQLLLDEVAQLRLFKY